MELIGVLGVVCLAAVVVQDCVFSSYKRKLLNIIRIKNDTIKKQDYVISEYKKIVRGKDIQFDRVMKLYEKSLEGGK